MDFQRMVPLFLSHPDGIVLARVQHLEGGLEVRADVVFGEQARVDYVRASPPAERHHERNADYCCPGEHEEVGEGGHGSPQSLSIGRCQSCGGWNESAARRTGLIAPRNSD